MSILPFKAESYFVTCLGNDKDDSENGPIANVDAISSCSSPHMVDRFHSRYYLPEVGTSPNGKCKNEYSGYGSTGVEAPGPNNNAFYLLPKAVTSASQTLAT